MYYGYDMKIALLRLAAAVPLSVALLVTGGRAQAATESGSVGLQGTISAPPPTQGATISIPRSGQSFTELPITVSGLCPNGLLVKLFKNNVFGGSAQCASGSFSIVTDLFSGTNELIARVYDDLDQAGPDSNVVTVSFSDPRFSGTRVSVTSTYAKRGAPPGSKLSWPLIISGGAAPYAVSIDWGDKTPPDLLSRPFAGEFNVTHTYSSTGIYNVVVKVTDKDGVSAFLQLVGVGVGPITQDTQKADAEGGKVITRQKVYWWPILLLVPLVIMAFWIGRRHQMQTIRKKIIRGERPF